MEGFVSVLKRLSEARGPSGFEDEVREVVVGLMERHVDEVYVDRWGNVIGVRRGASDLRAMVAAVLTKTTPEVVTRLLERRLK